MVSGSGPHPACPHTFATTATVTGTPKSYAEDPETTCDPLTASATPVAGGNHNVYGDCDTTAARSSATVRQKDSSMWPWPQDVSRSPRWRRRDRSRPYSGLQKLATTRPTIFLARGDDGKNAWVQRPIGEGTKDGKSLGIRRPVTVRKRRSQPRTGVKMAGKMLLYAMAVFFEQMELTVYLSLYKIKLLYNTLIAPVIGSW